MDMIYLPFCNQGNNDTWRDALENAFKSREKGGYDQLAQIRSKKPKNLKQMDEQYDKLIAGARTQEKAGNRDQKRSALAQAAAQLRSKEQCQDGDVVSYYEKLRPVKARLQKDWINDLIRKTASAYDAILSTIKDASNPAADLIIAAALPEFFWCDIRDDSKHPEIVGYGQRYLYDSTAELLLEDNPLMQLTKKYTNLVFFAGTALHKNIDNQDRSQEKVKNTLYVYADGKLIKTWGKHHFSTIDGFYGNIGDGMMLFKDKISLSTDTDPTVVFKGKRFAMDICLDFLCGDAHYKPVSTVLCENMRANKPDLKVDANILIASGMPVKHVMSTGGCQLTESAKQIESNILLRCDAFQDDSKACVDAFCIDKAKGEIQNHGTLISQNAALPVMTIQMQL